MKYAVRLSALHENGSPVAIDACVLNETQYTMFHEYLAGLIDIEPIIHCKDCKHHHDNDSGIYCREHGIEVTADYFCGDGDE